MLDKIKETFDKLIYDRLSSPLYGTFILSWLVWNWKIVYLTIVIDQEIVGNKISYIESHYQNPLLLLWAPLFSTIILIWLMPYATNAAHEATLKFDKRRIDKKNEIEKNLMLTYEQGAKILGAGNEIETKMKALVSARDEEIELYKQGITKLGGEKSEAIKGRDKLNIVVALWGNMDKKVFDVTEKVRLRVEGNKLIMQVDRDAIGGPDPVPGTMPLRLYVYFMYKGSPDTKVVPEGQILQIGDPAN
jgi:hypothetical protein